MVKPLKLKVGPVAMCHLLAVAFLMLGNVSGAEPAVDESVLPALPATEPEAALEAFDLEDGFRLEIVAAEPLIADPVAMSFDENGALYVAEMRDYSERREEALGRVRRLEDRDGDGRMDYHNEFVTGLRWPTGVLSHDGGLFVIAAPDLWFFKDHDGDGVADERRVVLTGFCELASRLNVQQLPNSLRWGIDQRIHIAEGGNGSRIRRPDESGGDGLVLRGRDLWLDPRTMEFGAENGGGQYGMSFDDSGRKFVSSNSRHLMQVAYDARYGGGVAYALPSPTVGIAVDGDAAPVFRRSPDEAWRVVRTRWRVAGMVSGPIEGGGTPSGYFTGATGVQIYRGDLFPEQFRGNAFIADAGSNLVHCKVLSRDGVLMSGARANPDERREFLASPDNWFRPVQIENGPDGALYVIDMYREVIEHPWSLPPGIKQHIDLNRGNDRGRIWRIVPDGASPRREVRLSGVPWIGLAWMLEHPNGWNRDTASRLLMGNNRVSVAAAVKGVFATSKNDLARLHALWLLSAKGNLNREELLAAMADESAIVKRAAVRLSMNYFLRTERSDESMSLRLIECAADADPEVRFETALVLGSIDVAAETREKVWNRLLARVEDDPWQREALIRMQAPHAEDWVARQSDDVWKAHGELMNELARIGARDAGASAVSEWLKGSVDAEEPFRSIGIAAAAVSVGIDPVALGLTARQERYVAAAAREYVASGTSVWKNFGLESTGLLDAESARAALLEMIDNAGDSTLRQTAVERLLSYEDDAIFADLLDRWAKLGPGLRERVANAALKSASWSHAVLNRAERDVEFWNGLSVSFRQALRGSEDQRIRERAIAVLGVPESAQVSEKLERYRAALTGGGDVSAGREIYHQRCAVCHRAGEEGSVVGPDLVTVAAAGRDSLLQNILDPAREVAGRFEMWVVQQRDGSEIAGLLAGESDAGLTILMAGGVERFVPREDILSFRNSETTLMPEGLDEGLAVDQMRDLLRFIESLAFR